MFTDTFEQMLKTNKNFANPFSLLQKTVAETYKRMAEESLEMMNENMARCSDQLKRFYEVKKPEDFLILQKDILQENINATIENVQKLVHLSIANLDESNKATAATGETLVKSTEKASDKLKEKERF